MSIPDIMDGDHEGQACKLKRTLYVLRVAPRAWYELFSEGLTKSELTTRQFCVCVFKKEYVFLNIYLDDSLVVGKGEIVSESQTGINVNASCE